MNLQEVMGRGNRARRKRKFFDDPEKKGAATFSELKKLDISIPPPINVNYHFEQGKPGAHKAEERKKDKGAQESGSFILTSFYNFPMDLLIWIPCTLRLFLYPNNAAMDPWTRR